MLSTQISKLNPILARSFSSAGLVIILIALALVAAIGWLAIVKTEGRSAMATTSNLRTQQTADLTKSLTRSGFIGDGVEADVILTTPEFFKLTNRTQDAKEMNADRSIVF